MARTVMAYTVMACIALAECLWQELVQELASLSSFRSSKAARTLLAVLDPSVLPPVCEPGDVADEGVLDDAGTLLAWLRAKTRIVSDDETLAEVSGDIARQQPLVVAVDCEWRPEQDRARNPVALCQLAWAGHVCLVDLVSLAPSEALSDFFRLCFSGIVVGWGLDNDLQRLDETLGHPFTQLGRAFTGLRTIDLIPLLRGGSLMNAVRRFLRIDLDKTMQTSDWQTRPLTASQLEYAAADAYIILPLLCRVCGGSSGGPTAAELLCSDTTILADALSKLPVGTAVTPWHDLRLPPRNLAGTVVASPTKPAQPFQSDVPCRPSTFGVELPALRVADVSAALMQLGFEHPDVGPDPPALVVKSLAVMAGSLGLVVCVIECERKLCLRKCASVLGLRKSDLAMVSEARLVEVCGYPKGGIGPVGLRSPATILLDINLRAHVHICCGAGAESLHFCTSCDELQRLLHATVADIAITTG